MPLHELTPGEQLAQDQRVPALDGVRGVAILLVLAHHCGRGDGVSVVTDLFTRISAAGWVGVDLFFVLSGFLITQLLLEARGRPRGLERFWIRRALRILPLAYLFLAAVFFSPLWRQEPWHPGLYAEQAWFWLYANNWMGLASPALDRGVLGHFWSLAIEAQFYLLWPFVVLAVAPRRLARLCELILVASLVVHVVAASRHARTDLVCSLTPVRLDGLLFGAWLATRRHAGARSIAFLRSHRALFIAAGAIAIVLIGPARGLPAGNRWVMSVGFSGLALMFTLLVAGLLSSPASAIVRRFCEARPLASLGRISYGFYVLHAPVVAELRKRWAPTGSGADWVGFFLAAFLISTLFAAISWFGLERPLLRLRAAAALRWLT